MNNRGFSVVLVVVLLVIAIIVLAIAIPAISRTNKEKSIENQINNLNITASLSSKQCSGGGIDAAPYCRYVYSDNGNLVETALKNDGYTANAPTTVDGNTTVINYNGGNSGLSIKLTIYNGMTTLDAERAN